MFKEFLLMMFLTQCYASETPSPPVATDPPALDFSDPWTILAIVILCILLVLCIIRLCSLIVSVSVENEETEVVVVQPEPTPRTRPQTTSTQAALAAP